MARIPATLWLDLLRTPMAAPETGPLRRMRFTWQALCILTAVGVGYFGPLHRALGRTAPVAAGVLLIATVLYTILYLARKNAADNAFLEQAGDGE